jgi:hypothetical protein
MPIKINKCRAFLTLVLPAAFFTSLVILLGVTLSAHAGILPDSSLYPLTYIFALGQLALDISTWPVNPVLQLLAHKSLFLGLLGILAWYALLGFCLDCLLSLVYEQ